MWYSFNYGNEFSFPGGASGKEPPANARDERVTSSIPGGWQPTLVFLPGESHGQRHLAVYGL